MRFFLIGYVAKSGATELSSIRGEVVNDGDSLRSYSEIRESCLDFANRDSPVVFDYIQINFITQVDECDYNSFMEK